MLHFNWLGLTIFRRDLRQYTVPFHPKCTWQNWWMAEWFKVLADNVYTGWWHALMQKATKLLQHSLWRHSFYKSVSWDTANCCPFKQKSAFSSYMQISYQKSTKLAFEVTCHKKLTTSTRHCNTDCINFWSVVFQLLRRHTEGHNRKQYSASPVWWHAV